MSDKRKVQLESSFDASGVKQGTQQAKEAVRDLARDVQATAQQAGDAPKAIGDGFRKAGAEVERSERSIIASLQRQTARFESAGKGARAYQEALILQRGMDPAKFEPYLSALDKADQAQRKSSVSLGQMGVSAGQTQAALRQLPAQFTDIFTSLASGQAPMLVLLQQGGQIKDSFGGIGNAIRGVASAISPMALAVGGVVAAAGGLAWAYHAGAAEDAAFRRSLVLTGNAAGATESDLRDMAQSVSSIAGSQGQAAEVLAMLAAQGTLGAQGFEQMAEAAIRLERVGGPAAEKTVAAFAKLAKDPLKAAVELNEATNFLTVSLYRQIKALEESGDKAGAAALASKAFAAAMVERGAELETRMGSIERGWKNIKDAIIGAKDALLSIGRDASLTEQLKDAQGDLERARRRAGMAAFSSSPQAASDVAAAEARVNALKETIQLSRRMATVDAERAASTKAVIEADKEAKKHSSDLATEERKRIGLISELAGLQADYYEQLNRLQAMRKAGAISEEQYVAAITALIQKQPAMVQAERERNAVTERRNKLLKEEEEAEKRRIATINGQLDALAQQQQALDDEFVELTRGKDAREQVVQQRMDDAAAMGQQAASAELLANGYTLEYAKLQTLADSLNAVAAARRRNTAQAATNSRAEDLRQLVMEQQRASDAWLASVYSGLTDTLRQSFLQDGSGFAKTFARGLGVEVKTQLAQAMAVLGVQSTVAYGQILASLVSDQATAEGGVGWASTAMRTGSMVNNMYGLYTGNGGGLAGLGAAANYANVYSGAAYGTAYGSQQSAMLAAQEGGMVNASTAGWGTWAGYAAMLYAAYMISDDAYRKGFTTRNGDWVNEGELSNLTARGLESLGIGSERFNQIFSGAAGFNRLFGHGAPTIQEQGITGTLRAGDLADDRLYADVRQKGGWFRSDKNWTEYAQVPDDLGRFMDEAAKSVYAQAKAYGEALGLPAEALASISTQVRIELTDDAAENQKAIAAALGEYGDALVDAWAAAVAPLQQYGETTAATIARVGTALVGVNDVLETLGFTALQASVDGGKAAMALQALFGDLAGLQNAAGGFLQNFYSESEREALTRGALTDTLAGVDLVLPATRDGFRALVDELIDGGALLTDSGRQQVATLLAVSDAFASITPSAEELAAESERAAAALAQAAAAIASERENLQVQLWQARGDTDALAAYDRSKIDPSNLDLYDELQRAKAEQAAAAAAADAQAAWQEAAAAAAAAADQVRQQWVAVADTIRDEIRRLRGLGSDGGATSLAAAQSAFTLATAQARAGDLSAAQQLPELSRAYSQAAEAVASSSTELEIMIARIAASLSETYRRIGGAPGFAAGGTHFGGLRLVGERAPELEVTGPSRIYTIEQLMQAAGSGGTGLAAMQAELQALRAEQRQAQEFIGSALLGIARNTGQTAAALDDAARGRRPLKTTEAP